MLFLLQLAYFTQHNVLQVHPTLLHNSQERETTYMSISG